jgi:hypothetical protein
VFRDIEPRIVRIREDLLDTIAKFALTPSRSF